MKKLSRKFQVEELINFIRAYYTGESPIALHRPYFDQDEIKYVNDCISSSYVSSVGEYVSLLEQKIQSFTNSKYAVATVNGTSALHLALIAANVQEDDLVLTQSLTFIATCNAIRYLNADPLFLDIENKTLGICPKKLKSYLENNCYRRNNSCFHKDSNKKISACVPMHTFGYPSKIEEIVGICDDWYIPVIEDVAEGLGSTLKGKHLGNFGLLGTLSFNGNKIITTGGGGMVITNDEQLALKIKHLSTQAKIPHPWEFRHDEIGYNYRMPNLNAALGCAQMNKLNDIIIRKKHLTLLYAEFCKKIGLKFLIQDYPNNPNYWLNSILLDNKEDKEYFLKELNNANINARGSWEPISELKMYRKCYKDNLNTTLDIADRILNLPSSYKTK